MIPLVSVFRYATDSPFEPRQLKLQPCQFWAVFQDPKWSPVPETCFEINHKNYALVGQDIIVIHINEWENVLGCPLVWVRGSTCH